MLTPEDVLDQTFTQTQFREGYDEREVDDFLDRVVASLRQHHGAPTGRTERLVTAADVRAVRFTPTRMRRGYDTAEVDAFVDRAASALEDHEEGRVPPPDRRRPAAPATTVRESVGSRLLRTLRGDPRP